MFHSLMTPGRFHAFTGRLLPWLAWPAALLMAAGLVTGLYFSPPDYQQSDTVRIMYVHVPSAWVSLFGYVFMAGAGLTALVWRVKVAEAVSIAAAPVGAWFTVITLATGSLWGRPMWGTWWEWDPRLTSELVLLFLYLGVIALYNAVPDRRKAARATAILMLVGVVNVPIVHFSVEWWSSLHQGPSVSKLDAPSIHVSMLVPLLLMAVGTTLAFVAVTLERARAHLVEAEVDKRWVKQLVIGEKP